jgi:glucose/mannose-6-phosphate isomerase
MSQPFLDTIEEIKTLDAHNALGAIEEMGSQISQVWESVQNLAIPADYAEATNIVVAGMGGSVLGTHVIQTLFKDQIKVPIIIAPDYEVPAFVNSHTLVVASSYSGSTEETLAATKDAFAKGAKVMGITSGGALAALLAEHNAPCLVFDPIHNPSNCARMGLGYSIFGQIALMAKAGHIVLQQTHVDTILEVIAQAHVQQAITVEQATNPAKILAFQLYQKIPVITVAEHLEGIAHVFANQLNENAKTFSEYRVIPELNHHLLEGLKFPEGLKSEAFFLSLGSSLYHPSNQLRLKLTQELYQENGLECLLHTVQASSKIGQAFELLVFAAYTSFYLAMLYNQDPIPNPNVDWLKKTIKERS